MSAVARAARVLVGRRFRLHGRGETLDCVGVVALALRGAGWRGEVPSGYALRGGDPAVVAGRLDAALVRVEGDRRGDWPGDVLLMAVGPGQLHLGIRTDGGFVHADAGLARVVERLGAPPWPVIGIWRWEEG